MNIVKDLYNYRELLKTSVTKDIGGKYKHSFLGILWSFVNPLLQIIVYAFVFQVILKSNIENYAVYLCCGLVPWQYFSSVVLRGAAIMLDNGNIIKKVYFPREILPISVVTSQLVNFLISTIIILAFVLFSGMGISKYILFYPVILLIQYIFSIGVAFIVSSATVFLRDLEHLISIAMMMLFYATPIAYSADTIPANFSFIITLNPMAHILNAYRDIFYYQRMPELQTLAIIFAISVVLFVVGYAIFNKLQKSFAEEL